MTRAGQSVIRVVSLVMAMAAMAGAQQPTPTPPSSERLKRHVTVRVDTSDHMKITVVLDGLDSLMRTLVQSRALEERLGLALREYGAASQQANAARRQALEEQLRKLAENNVQLMSKIQIACTSQAHAEHAPEGYLGVTFGMSGDMKREKNGLEVFRFDEPPEIITVEGGSPADKAGVRRGDRMLAIDGRDVTGRDVVFSQFLVPGRKVPLRLSRDGREQSVVVMVQKRPDTFGNQCTDLDLAMLPMPGQPVAPGKRAMPAHVVPPAAPSPPNAPAPPSSVWTFEAPPPVAIAGFSSLVAGAQLTTLTDDFKELTGADGGVMVQRVAPESPAAAAGLRGGDVIVEADERPVTSARFLQRLISDTDERALKLKVVRKGKARTVNLKW